MQRNLLHLMILLVALCLSLPRFSARGQADYITIAYIPSDANIPNPERGFYHQDSPMWLDTERVPQDGEELREMRDEGITMLRWYFLIDEFRDRPLDDEALTYIEAQFAAARQAGLKVIPRFAYNFPQGGEYPYQDPDAPLERVLAHIDQLTPLLQGNSDVIAFMEIGFVGAWGEWHSSTHRLVDEETGINANSNAIINRLLAALPSNRMIAMRYPPYKQQLYGDAPTNEAIAFSGIPQARLGAHNDCFLASETDWGTYPEDANARQTLRNYLSADNRFVPQGGETCNAAEDAEPFINCENALSELALLRYSTLNIDYNTDVLDIWREQGCFDEITRRLGYRFRLIEAEMMSSVQQGGVLHLQLRLINEGFASPYNPRSVEIVLRSAESGQLYILSPQNMVEPRLWLPDLGEIDVPLEVLLPPDLPPGKYEVLLNLPDPTPSLYSRPEYAIQLANAEVWEAETGYNHLLASVDVVARNG
jgi:hypothetical protein